MAKPVNMVEGTDAKAKIIENMQAAFKGETTASAKYAAYSKKAEQEGYHEIALLFKSLQPQRISMPITTRPFYKSRVFPHR
ncbi:MAG: hypothetical protein IPP96_14095 [Chitinophagaceae bacterium]|nr:hypothetical protein [Chitinophagaceae bacterium]